MSQYTAVRTADTTGGSAVVTYDPVESDSHDQFTDAKGNVVWSTLDFGSV
jgi:hypothetical protein